MEDYHLFHFVELVKIELAENIHGEFLSGCNNNSLFSSAGRQQTFKMIRSRQAEIMFCVQYMSISYPFHASKMHSPKMVVYC